MTSGRRQPFKLWIAGIFAILGAIAIWAGGAMHQEEQTRTLSRRWLAQQWVVARTCLSGSGRRGGDRAALEAALAERADQERWPERCLPALASIRPQPGEASGALESVHALEALAARVRGDPARARELAEPILALDRSLPVQTE